MAADRDYILKTLVGLFVLAIVMLIVMSEVANKRDRAADLVVRTEICASACVSRESEFHKAYKQSLGWGADEWRCGCMDGHVQVIP